MPLPADAKLGPYEIVAALGAGGMGEVYRARDTRLQRDVAIKVLPAAFTSDLERLRRFEQEALATASLNHPNILAVFDVGTATDGTVFVVSELLEGATLRDALTRSALPLRKVLDYALQIARGLAAAHDKGIVHRDLKPENLFVTRDEHVKILDFGLAKVTAVASSQVGQTALNTMPPQSQAGVVLGTIGYMSPEQVRGLTVDSRSDIFSFGCVLYEMLAGRRAFGGATSADTMSAILNQQPPDITPTPDRMTPPALARIVERCLEKEPAARFQSTSDLAFAVAALSTTTATSVQPIVETVLGAGRATSRTRERLFAAGTVGLLLLSLSLAGLLLLRPHETTSAMRFELPLPETPSESGASATLALSPDGRSIAIAGEGKYHRLKMWVRALDAASARALDGTEGARNPFWSPDGRFIAFFSRTQLKKIELTTGRVQTICDASGVRTGGDWNRDGAIVFSTDRKAQIRRVSANGGSPVDVTALTDLRLEAYRPHFLQDGRRFLFQGPQGVYVGSLDSTATRLLAPALEAQYAPPDHLLMVEENGTIAAVHFDPERVELSGEHVAVAEAGSAYNGQNLTNFSVTPGGLIAFQPAVVRSTTLVWRDRGGRQIATLLGPSGWRNPQLSPDGSHLAVSDTDERTVAAAWTIDLARGIKTRLSAGGGFMPLWASADSVIFSRSTGRIIGVPRELARRAASGDGDEQLLTDIGSGGLDSVSPDRRFGVSSRMGPAANRDIYLVPLTGEGKALPLLQTRANETQGQISPDGRWIAYTSDESGESEIYAQRFPGGGGKIRLSTTGGMQSRWRRDGRELFYLQPDGALMSVLVTLAADIKADGPATLFAGRIAYGGPGLGTRAEYDVTADGRRFIVNQIAEGEAPPPITVIVNWTALLKK